MADRDKLIFLRLAYRYLYSQQCSLLANLNETEEKSMLGYIILKEFCAEERTFVDCLL